MNEIDAEMLKRAFLAGAKGLESKKEWINELNVFPVPDGDTGTNMTMTILSAAREVAAIEHPTMESLAKAISSGSLRGARGNSGVILSQLFRGFAKEIRTVDVITTTTLSNAINRATETAYKAVMKPKEGTILTVARGMADKASELVSQTDDMIEFCEAVIRHGDYVLSQTPEMLPVLKEAGVVDSGGQGLMQVLKGAMEGLRGKEVEFKTEDMQLSDEGAGSGLSGSFKPSETLNADILFGYCTEFIINVEQCWDEKTEQELKAYLESIGDSIVVVSDEDVVKVHLHTNDPGLAIQKALACGSLSRIKIDNMREEHQERLIKDAERIAAEKNAERIAAEKNAERIAAEKNAERIAAGQKEAGQASGEQPAKPYGFIAVTAGKGLGEIFRGIGADALIEGGQTMNPSTEDILRAVEAVHADTVYILPNNKNIILAAEQAKCLVKDKTVVVVPSQTVPQGISAIINFAPDLSAKENLSIMTDEMERVKTGQITYAVRTTAMNGKEIHEGDIMGLGDTGLLAVGTDTQDTALETLRELVDKDSELITIYYGEEVEEQEALELSRQAAEQFPGCEIELHSGGQPVYYYLLSVE